MKSAESAPYSVVGVALATQAAVSMLQQGLPSISIPIQDELRLGLAGLGLVLGAANAATAASVYAWGRWSDRVGDRRVLLAGLLVAAPGLAAVAGAVAGGHRTQTVAWLLVAGAGAGAGTAALARALADRVPAPRLGLALGLRQAAVPVGGLTAAAVLPAVASSFGVGTAFGVLALVCAAAGLGVAIWLPESPRSTSPSGVREAAEAPTPKAARLLGFPALLAANACYCVAQTGAVSLSVAAWHTGIGVGARPAALMFVEVQAGSCVLRVGLGRAGDRRPDREPAILIMLGSCTAALLTALVLAHAARLPAVLQAWLLSAACLPASGWNGLAFARSTRLAVRTGNRHRLGRIHGLQNTVLFTAVGLTPPVLTAVAAAAGWTLCWSLLAACAAVGVLIHVLSPAPIPLPRTAIHRTTGAIRMRIARADHFVLTVREIDATVDWYREVLGMEPVAFGAGRRALAFGNQKLNLHQAGREPEPRAAEPTPGSADLCLISAVPLDEVRSHLRVLGVPIELGPVARTGANGPITSVYLRDPDQNLLELSAYDAGRPQAPDPYDLLPPVPTLSLAGGDVADGARLDPRHVHDRLGGGNQSPALAWTGAPLPTRGFAVTCYDPDAPTGSGFWHWLLLGLPADCDGLPAGAGSGDGAHLPAGAFHLRNDFGQASYGGAYPPAGDREHRYLFAVHALDTDDLGLRPDHPAGYAGFVMTAHTIARGVLRPTFRHA